MTVIAGVVSGGKVWIGGDSAGVNDRGDLQLRKDSKVFRFGQLLIGCSGSWRINQRIKYLSPTSLEPPETSVNAHWYLCNCVLPWLREFTKDLPEEEFELLIGFCGHLFHTYGARQVSEEIAGYEACGCGAQVSRGSLFTSSLSARMDMNPKWRIENALQAAERFCSGVRGPFNILEI